MTSPSNPTSETETLRERHIALRRSLERLHRSATIAYDHISEREHDSEAVEIVNALATDLDEADEVLGEYP